MAYALKNKQDQLEETPFGRHIVIDDIATAYGEIEKWSDAELKANGLLRIENMTVPAGKMQSGTPRLVESNGKAIRTYDLIDIPPKDPAIYHARVDEERDRRISAGFEFNGKRYQSRAKDRENILGAASLAHMALTIGGKAPTDPKWHGGTENFVWIAEDNSLVPMTAPVVIAFGQAAAEHKSAHTFAARNLKSVEPTDSFADDRFWP